MPISLIREGFKDERLLILPHQVVDRLATHPVAAMLYPTRIGHFPRAAGHSVIREQAIDEHILIFCEAGSGSGAVGTQHFTLSAGQVALLPADQVHHYQSALERPWSISWIHFRGQLAEAYTAALGITTETPSLSIGNPDQVREQFEHLYGLTRGNYSDTTLLTLHTELASFIATLARGRRESIPKQRDRAERIAKVIRHLRNNLHRSVELAEMAGIAHWTSNHFNTTFRQQLNETPAAFFMHLKMAHACECLKSTDLPIKHIAAELGFEDAFYFSRCFKRCYRISPSQFRRIA